MGTVEYPSYTLPLAEIFCSGVENIMRTAWRVLSISVLNVAVLLCGAAHHRANAQTLFHWVEVGPEGTSVVRAITENACPNVVFDGHEVATSLRSEINQKFDGADPAFFPVRVCEVQVPTGAIAGTLEGNALPIARPNPQRIVVIGDTGCRVKVGDPIQACNDPKSWPFSRIAAAAAAARPDLVIHVGDYAYRETLCPAGEAKCAGSPEPYGWEAWKADFFRPAKPLLEAAPWIMVRGNHELCQRAGNGWFRFLDIAETGSPDISGFELPCRDLTAPYIARLGAFGVMVVDGASASVPHGDLSGLANVVGRALADLPQKLPSELWIATHPPIGLQLAAAPGDGPTNSVPRNVSMVVSGHYHFFHSVRFAGDSVPQAVIGIGGTNLDDRKDIAKSAKALGGGDSLPSLKFGYMVWDKSDGIWSATLFDPDGSPTNGHCKLEQRALDCKLLDNGGKVQ